MGMRKVRLYYRKHRSIPRSLIVSLQEHCKPQFTRLSGGDGQGVYRKCVGVSNPGCIVYSIDWEWKRPRTFGILLVHDKHINYSLHCSCSSVVFWNFYFNQVLLYNKYVFEIIMYIYLTILLIMLGHSYVRQKSFCYYSIHYTTRSSFR